MPGEFSSKRNLLFDLDGTLIDSEGAHARAYLATLRLYQPALADDFDYAAIAGQPTAQVFGSFGFTGEKLEVAVRAKQIRYRDMINAGEIMPFPEVETTLEQLQGSGRRLYLVTGASRISVGTLLRCLKLEAFFQGVIVGEDTSRGKPMPDPYLSALRKFDLHPEECLAVEDSENGARSALAAGLDCVLIRSTATFPRLNSYSNLQQLFALLSPS